MEEGRLSLYISNTLILMPAIVTFIYLFPKEYVYWNDWYLLPFVIPFVKYFMPRDWRRHVYPLIITILLFYIIISDLKIILKTGFFLSTLFVLPVTQKNVNPIFFTLFTSIVFLFIFEGILSKKTAKTVYYMFLSITSTVYFLSALELSSLAGISFMDAYSYTSILLFYNVYTLIFKGYEFLTLIITPSAYVVNMLIVTAIFSIVGLIMNLNVLGTDKNSRSLEGIGYPILAGGIGALILSFVLVHLPYSLYSLLLTVLVIIIFISIVSRSDRKQNYPIRVMEDNEIRSHNSE